MLFVEDSEDDVLLLCEELRRGQYDVRHRQVASAPGMRDALAAGDWDLVLSEFTLPSWDAQGALSVLHEAALDLPFIIVSGTIREEAAVTALKAGAHDFVSKNRLARFLPVVARELGEAEVREQRRQTEAALREQERTYRRIVETTHEGIWMLGRDGATSYANRRMAELLAVAPDDLAAARFWDFVASESLGAARCQLGSHHPTQGPRAIRFIRGDGSDFWADLATNAINDDEGAPLGFLVMVKDITEHRRLQEQLMVSDRLASVGILAAGVAHEINNPLTAVLWNLASIRGELATLHNAHPDTVPGASLHECLDDAVEAANRVRDIARDLKVFSRPHDDVSQPVDLVRVITSSIRMARTEIRHRARIRTEFNPVRPIIANESRLGQVFLNLIVNAAHAIDAGRVADHEIVIATGVAGPGHIYAEVRDTGCGMPPEVLDHLFTPFFTTKPRGVGTGLGLSICRRIITALDGTISATSTVGVGSTFRITLPTSPDRTGEDVPEAPDAPPPPATTRRGRVLIVDDEVMILRTIARLLAAHHDVESFERASDALDRVRAGARYDVILCDLMMPDMTGVDLHEALAEHAPALARKMLFLTGGAFTHRTRAFIDRPDIAWVEKPFDPVHLAALVNSHVTAGDLDDPVSAAPHPA